MLISRWVSAPIAAGFAFFVALPVVSGGTYVTGLVIGLPLGMDEPSVRVMLYPYNPALAIVSALIAWTCVGSWVAPRAHRRLACGLFSAVVVVFAALATFQYLYSGTGRPLDPFFPFAMGSWLACAALSVVWFVRRRAKAALVRFAREERTAVRVVSKSQRTTAMPAPRLVSPSYVMAGIAMAALATAAALNYPTLYVMGTYPVATYGNATAQNNLGAAYGKGWGVRKDDEAALRWFLAAANQGDPAAQFNVGVVHEQGRGVPVNFETAAAYYRLAAENGNPAAQTNLGNLYRDGAGMKQDYAAALEWFQKAADTGFAPAQYNLGTMYEEGAGVAIDIPQADAWYAKAAEQGLAQARLKFPAKYPRPAASVGATERFRDMVEVLKLAKAAGTISEKDEELLTIYLGNRAEVPGALRKHRERANRGDADAQFNLSEIYRSGISVPKDLAESARWVRMAAENGHVVAAFNLGMVYHQGFGLQINLAEAETWIGVAAERGHVDAQIFLGWMNQKRQTARPDLVQAYKWYTIAAGRITREDDPKRYVAMARDVAIVTSSLRPDQLAEAKRLAQEWRRITPPGPLPEAP
jgi:uncharacterized protein